jgi:hypothetical protein
VSQNFLSCLQKQIVELARGERNSFTDWALTAKLVAVEKDADAQETLLSSAAKRAVTGCVL